MERGREERVEGREGEGEGREGEGEGRELQGQGVTYPADLLADPLQVQICTMIVPNHPTQTPSWI